MGKIFEDTKAIFVVDGWAIYRNDDVNAHCLRHTKGHEEGGQCSCTAGKCVTCNEEAPIEITGFLALLEWKT